jgi:hypothetical protein
VEGYACDVASVAIEAEERVGVRRLDVVELDRVVTGRGQVALIWRDA